MFDFLSGRATRALDLGDLVEGQFDGRLASEDGHQHLELLLFGVDLADRRRQRRERSVHDGHRLADLEVDQDLRTLQRRLRRSSGRRRTSLARLLRRALGQQELHHVVQRQRGRPRRRADEAGHAGGVAHRAPRLVVELHADQDVARQHLAVDLLALAVLDLGDLFGRNLDLEDVVADVEVLHAGLEVGLHLVLVTGIGVDDKPVARLAAQLSLERVGRIELLLGHLGDGFRRLSVRRRLELRCGLVRCRRRCGSGLVVDDVDDGLTRGRIAFGGCHGSQSSLKTFKSAEHQQHQLAQAQVHAADQRDHEGQERQHHPGVADHLLAVRPDHLSQLGDYLLEVVPHEHERVPGRPGGGLLRLLGLGLLGLLLDAEFLGARFEFLRLGQCGGSPLTGPLAGGTLGAAHDDGLTASGVLVAVGACGVSTIALVAHRMLLCVESSGPNAPARVCTFQCPPLPIQLSRGDRT